MNFIDLSKYSLPRQLAWVIVCSLCLLPITTFSAQDEHVQEENEGEHTEFVEIPIAMANELGIGTAIAGGGSLDLSLRLFGKTMPDPQLVSHITARYPGMIQRIVPVLGARVQVGQVIAEIEANNSLQTYAIRAPISGTVVDKHANPGELATDQSLMTIANYDRLWVDLTVFPGDSQRVKQGMAVNLSMEDLRAQSRISYLNPSQSDSPTLIARVPLDNEQGSWSPGLLVEGVVVIERANVDLLVNNVALQLYEGNFVVFVQEGEKYHPRAVELGRSDGSYTEVLSGLEAGERYVLDNSYLIKADLEKDGAEHDH